MENNMEKQYEELKSVLADELSIHSDLVKTAEKMNAAIKKKDVDTVKILTARYDEYIGQIETLENKRLELCDGITKALKPQNRHMNLKSIIAMMPKEQQKPFSDIGTSMKKKINELSRLNTSNQILLNESLTAIGKKFELITQFQNKLAGYKQSGTIDKEQVRRNIINHIA